jgi:hypothetical protein
MKAPTKAAAESPEAEPTGPDAPAVAPSADEEHIHQFFAYKHLPPRLAAVSEQFSKLADWLVVNLPRDTERTVALRKLLEAKDSAVRVRVAADKATQ